MEHYTRDADGLCVNLRKPCVQVIFKTPRAIFNQQQWSTVFLSIWRLMKFRILPRGLIMKSKLAQFPRRWLKPIVGPFWGARVSLLSSSASHWDIFISTYIWHNLPTTNSMAVIFMVFWQKNYFFFFNWAITDMAKSTLRLKKIVNFSIFCPLLSYDELSFSPTQL